MRHRRWPIAALAFGVTLLIGSVVFRVAAAPALVRFPLNVDETARYTGTATEYMDQATLLPLATPKREPLSISRHVKVVDGSFDRAVIDETVTITTGGKTNVENYQYVIDRRSMQMVADPRQYAFGDPAAVMHAAGAYRVNFAMGTNVKTAALAYIPEEDAVSHLVLVEGPHTHPDAHIKVLDFSSKHDGPVAGYYLAYLKRIGAPMQITAAQLAPLLLSEGIDVSRALADVGPRLTTAEKALVSTTLAKAVPLRYVFLSDGIISIEANTGALIDVHTQQQGIAVRPDLSGAAVLQPLFEKYAAIPSVKALADGLSALAKRPAQVAESYTYSQTVPSSLTVTNNARAHATTMNLVDVRIPWTAAALGLILVGVGLLGRRRSRGAVLDLRSDQAGQPPAPAERQGQAIATGTSPGPNVEGC